VKQDIFSYFKPKKKEQKMSSGKKNKKLNSGEGFTVDCGESLSLSLGSILGKEESARKEQKARPEGEKSPAQKALVKNDGESGISGLPKVTLQKQTAGRGGKTVTAVIIPGKAAVDREKLAREMRKGLGCGSFVEGGNVILQGDICDRAAEWLLKKGVKEVVSGF